MSSLERVGLEAERDFLLRSIADLDAEQASGDLNGIDHDALRDDYVARAADVIRQLDHSASDVRAPSASGANLQQSGGGRPRRSRAAIAVAGSVALAFVAGLLLARSAGSRPADAPLTGSLPTSNAQRLQEAGTLIKQGKAVAAIKLYDKVLKEDPKQPVALAYRGWLVRLAGLKDEGLGYEDRAVEADASYPDAHFFRGMMLWQDKKDPAGAVGEFRLFLANRPPRAMVALVQDALQRAAAQAGIPAE